MNHGKIEQIGSPDEVYSNPASPFVYQFLGNVNVFHSRLHGSYAEVELSRERHEALQLAAGQSVWFRPRQMKVFGGDALPRPQKQGLAPGATPEKQAFLF